MRVQAVGSNGMRRSLSAFRKQVARPRVDQQLHRPEWTEVAQEADKSWLMSRGKSSSAEKLRIFRGGGIDGSSERSVAEDVRDVGMGSATDDVIAAHARLNQQTLVTRDFDFAVAAHEVDEDVQLFRIAGYFERESFC